MKRSAPSSAAGAPAPKRPRGRYKSVFARKLQRLKAFTDANQRLPRISSKSAKKKASSSSSSEAYGDVSGERELRIFVDRRMQEHRQLMDIVSVWMTYDGSMQPAWQSTFDDLIKFREEKGRWPFTGKERGEMSEREAKLAAWCSKIRHAGSGTPNNEKRKHSIKLKPHHVSKLNELGFKWSFLEEQWTMHYNRLLEWLRNNNGVWPKTIWKPGGIAARSDAEQHEHKLAQWVSGQRQRYNLSGAKYKNQKNFKLPRWKSIIDAQRAKLTAIGMNWNPIRKRKA